MDMINVMIFKRGEQVKMVTIENNVDTIEAIIGGSIQVSQIVEGMCLIHNEKVNYENLFMSNFIVSAVDKDNNLCTMTQDQANQTLEIMGNPRREQFQSIN